VLELLEHWRDWWRERLLQASGLGADPPPDAEAAREAASALGVRAGWTASYHNGETPTEMLVYTMTSPDIVTVLRDVKRVSEQSGHGQGIPISVDGHSGFSWPWAWYFRNHESVGYPTYAGTTQPVNDRGGVVLVHVNNEALADEGLRDAGFTQVMRFKHRWWFPESYRNLTPGIVWNGLWDRDSWRSAFRYWLFREGGGDPEAVRRWFLHGLFG
jgi:hypothetical protein